MADRHPTQGLAAVSRTADALGRDEEWMRTDIRLFKLDRFSLPEIDGHRAASQLALRTPFGGRRGIGRATLSASNSPAWRRSLIPKLAEQGVLFGSLARLVREHGDLLRPFFERHVVDPHQDKFCCAERGLLVGRDTVVCAQEGAAGAAAAFAVGDFRRRG